MCGIAGYIGSNILEQERINNCLTKMQRRGPDAAGVFSHSPTPGRHVTLLHSRLSIIDCQNRANQPFHFGSKTLIFNGEIYNYIELQSLLRQQGYNFETSSDTEVLIKALDAFGTEGLDKCEGMWAFALYDKQANTLVLSRDRFGEKPLYLYNDNDGLYFASEPKFIFALLGRKLTVNHDHLCRYLVNGYQSLYKQTQNFFIGLGELAPASCLTIDNTNSKKICRYWTPQFIQEDTISYQEAVETSRELLQQSVQLRLRADVPLAFCLSGGIDSNSLISLAKRQLNYDVHGFTIVNTDKRYEEQEMVAHSVAELKIRHTPIPVETTNFIPRLRKLINYHDSPVATITYYAQWQLMERIAEHGYKIVISGGGADELFSGYYDHHLAYLHQMKLEGGKRYQEALSEWINHVKPLVRNPLFRDPELFDKNPGCRDYIYSLTHNCAEYLTNQWSEPFSEQNYSDTILRNRMANELFHESVPVILHEEDLNSMYFSIENRSPFLDRHLFEFSAKIPTRHLVRAGMAKAILRDAMAGIVPEKILTNRQKTGFNAPIYSYLDVNDSGVREYLLDQSPIFDYVKRDKIEQLITKKDLPSTESMFLFSFLSSKIFLEEHSV